MTRLEQRGALAFAPSATDVSTGSFRPPSRDGLNTTKHLTARNLKFDGRRL